MAFYIPSARHYSFLSVAFANPWTHSADARIHQPHRLNRIEHHADLTRRRDGIGLLLC